MARNQSIVTLDEPDRRVLECLRVDGRMPHSEIARRTGIAEATVRRRLQRLQDQNVLRVVPVVDPDRIGLETSVLLGIKVQGRAFDDVADDIAKLPEVRFVAVTTGPYDILVEAFVGSRQHLAAFLLDEVTLIDGVVSTETTTVLRIAKFAYEWEIPDLPDRDGASSGNGRD